MHTNNMSHPSWVCGLKHYKTAREVACQKVTPFVGVWIETELRIQTSGPIKVTPFVGVWIETIEDPYR